MSVAVPAVARVYPARWGAFYALGVMMLACLLSFLDRGILNAVVPAVEHDLGISDTQMSFLLGFSFTIFYSVMAIPFGWLADRVNRVHLIAGGIAAWSVMTVLTGLANSYPELLFARMGVGIGEATLMPASASLIADYFAPSQRGRAYSVFTMAVFTGGGSASLICGAILRSLQGHEVVSFPVFGDLAVWQSLFVFIGVPGILIALLVLTVREPARMKATPGPAALSDSADNSLTRYVGRHRAAFACVWGVYLLVAFVAFAVLPWAATMEVRKFGLTMAQANLMVGPTQMFAGVAGCLVCGILGDRWTRQGKRGGKFRLPLVSSIFVLPSLALFTLADSVGLSIVGLACYAAFNALAYASATAVIQDMVPAQLRGRNTSFWYLVTALGNGGGPLATALATDYVFGDKAAVPYAILLVAVPSVLLGFILSFIGLRFFDETCASVKAEH